MSLERREFERISFELSANYRVFLQKTLKREELFYGIADLVNISGGGIQVRLRDVAPELLKDLLQDNRKLLLEFTMNVADKPVTVRGKVAWANEEDTANAGICFVDIGMDEQKLILDYIDEKLSKKQTE